MSTKEKLQAAIQMMNSFGKTEKAEITALVEAITGTSLTEPEPTPLPVPQTGQVWLSFSSPRILVRLDMDCFIGVRFDGTGASGEYSSLEELIQNCGYDFVASSLEEYFTKGGKV